MPFGVSRITRRQGLGDVQAGAKCRQRCGQVALGDEDAADLVVADREVALPLLAVGLCLKCCGAVALRLAVAVAGGSQIASRDVQVTQNAPAPDVFGFVFGSLLVSGERAAYIVLQGECATLAGQRRGAAAFGLFCRHIALAFGALYSGHLLRAKQGLGGLCVAAPQRLGRVHGGGRGARRRRVFQRAGDRIGELCLDLLQLGLQ